MKMFLPMLLWFFAAAVAFGSITSAFEALSNRAYLKFLLLLIFGGTIGLIVLATGLEFVFE